jgi:hypothetical protein
MDISNDYLDDNSPISQEFLSPIKQVFENNDTILKTVEIYAKYHLAHELTGSYRANYSLPYSEAPMSDLEIFNVFKASLAEPADSDEEDLSQEQLLEQRDPEGLRHLPLESEEIQSYIALFRKLQSEEQAVQPFERVKQIYQEVMGDIREQNNIQPLTLDHLDITVIYAKKSDLSTNLTFQNTASVAMA